MIFMRPKIDTAFRADTAVTHGKQRRRDIHPSNATVIDMSRKGNDILNDATPNGKHDGIAGEIILLKKGKSLFYSSKRLFFFGSGDFHDGRRIG